MIVENLFVNYNCGIIVLKDKWFNELFLCVAMNCIINCNVIVWFNELFLCKVIYMYILCSPNFLHSVFRKVCKESSIMDLQEEIVADILSRTPIVTIVHCRCVCKTWRTILSEPYFIHLHLPRSPVGLISHQSNSPDYEHYDIFKLGELGEEPDHHDVHFDRSSLFLSSGARYIWAIIWHWEEKV